MATAPSLTQARQFAQLIAELEPEVRRAFMASVTDLQANVNWPALLAALTSGLIDDAIAALNIVEEAWTEYSSSVTAAYAKAGASTAAQIRGAAVGVRFNMANPRAQEWIRENVAESVVGFTREARLTARTIIEAGYARGEGSRTIATDLVGRVENGVRTGGVLGLDNPRAMRLDAVTRGMRTADGVKDLVLTHNDGSLSVRYKVNKATEQRILRAYRSGTAVSAEDRAISDRQYKNALLKDRADTVASTETANAVLSARQEEWRQLAESQGLDQSAIKKTWKHRRGSDGRATHIAMNEVSVMGLETPFVLSDGSVMQHPHDVSGGARNNINCGCDVAYSLQRRGL